MSPLTDEKLSQRERDLSKPRSHRRPEPGRVHTDVLPVSETLPGHNQSLTRHIPSNLAPEPPANQTGTVVSGTVSASKVSGAVVNPSKPVRLDLRQQPVPAPHLSGREKAKFL